MSNLEVKKDICIRCGQCAGVCPSGAIQLKENSAFILADVCDVCYMCFNACTQNAIINSMEQSKNCPQKEVNDKICILIEHHSGEILPSVLEVLYCASELKDKSGYQIAGILIGNELDELYVKVLEYGVDEVWTYQNSMISEYSEELIIDSATQIIQMIKPEVFLASGTIMGRSIMPGISSRLETGLCADCVRIEFDKSKNSIYIVRPAYGGKIMAKISIPNKRPQMATIKPKIFPEIEKGEKKGKWIDVSNKIVLYQPLITILENKNLIANLNKLESAKIVVGFGLGVKDQKNIDLIYRFAALIEASVGASRAIVDAGWIESEWQIGQSGKIIKPDIYIACGISGAVQHLVGIKDAKLIISINSNRSAPIVEISNYAIIGKLEEVIPDLIKEIGKRKKYKQKNRN